MMTFLPVSGLLASTGLEDKTNLELAIAVFGLFMIVVILIGIPVALWGFLKSLSKFFRFLSK